MTMEYDALAPLSEGRYSSLFDITDLHADCFGRLKPAVMLYFAQETAGRHSAVLGVGAKALQQKGLFWALTRTHLQIDRIPSVGETLRVETWPMPATRVAYPRFTMAWDAQGRVCFRSISLWVLMDQTSRSMVLPGKSGVEVPGFTFGGELAMPGGLAVKELSRTAQRTVRFSDLDQNMHMNNTRCLSWLEDLLPASFHSANTPRDITVCYHREAREGDVLQLEYDLLSGGVLQLDAARDGQRIFAVKAEY